MTQSKSVTFKMRLTETQSNQLDKLCEIYGMSYQDYIRKIIADAWEKHCFATLISEKNI